MEDNGCLTAKQAIVRKVEEGRHSSTRSEGQKGPVNMYIAVPVSDDIGFNITALTRITKEE